MKQVIFINGLKRSGKDYSAEIIQQILGKIEIVSIASPLKQIIADTFGISKESLENYKNDDVGLYLMYDEGPVRLTDFRKILQNFGTEAMKAQFGDDIWIDKALNTIVKSKRKFIVVTDFRMIIEYEKALASSEINDFNLTTINIFNKDLPTADLHSTERELSDNNFKFDYVINNTGKPKNIKDTIEKILNKISQKSLN